MEAKRISAILSGFQGGICVLFRGRSSNASEGLLGDAGKGCYGKSKHVNQWSDIDENRRVIAVHPESRYRPGIS